LQTRGGLFCNHEEKNFATTRMKILLHRDKSKIGPFFKNNAYPLAELISKNHELLKELEQFLITYICKKFSPSARIDKVGFYYDNFTYSTHEEIPELIPKAKFLSKPWKRW